MIRTSSLTPGPGVGLAQPGAGAYRTLGPGNTRGGRLARADMTSDHTGDSGDVCSYECCLRSIYEVVILIMHLSYSTVSRFPVTCAIAYVGSLSVVG